MGNMHGHIHDQLWKMKNIKRGKVGRDQKCENYKLINRNIEKKNFNVLRLQLEH